MFDSRIRTCISPKALALAGLVLALSLAPTAAAKKGGTERPFKFSGTGIALFTPATGSLVADTTDVGTHIGKGSTHYEPTVAITGPGTVSLGGPVVTTAANGDRLLGHLTGTGTFTPECVPAVSGCIAIFSGVIEIRGGTGRFRRATGTVAVSIRNVLTAGGATRTYASESAGRGTISY